MASVGTHPHSCSHCSLYQSYCRAHALLPAVGWDHRRNHILKCPPALQLPASNSPATGEVEFSISSFQRGMATPLKQEEQWHICQNTALLIQCSHTHHVVLYLSANHFSYRNKHCQKHKPCPLHVCTISLGLSSLYTWAHPAAPQLRSLHTAWAKRERNVSRAGTPHFQLHSRFKNCWGRHS